MRKIMFIGRTGAGKTTLTQALKGEDITYQKTQDVQHFNAIIDTPGEYCENKELAHAARRGQTYRLYGKRQMQSDEPVREAGGSAPLRPGRGPGFRFGRATRIWGR